MTTQGSPTAWEPELFPGRDPELVRGPAPWQRSLTDRTPRGPSGGGGRAAASGDPSGEGSPHLSLQPT